MIDTVDTASLFVMSQFQNKISKSLHDENGLILIAMRALVAAMEDPSALTTAKEAIAKAQEAHDED